MNGDISEMIDAVIMAENAEKKQKKKIINLSLRTLSKSF
jgi:hypothetical protein